MINYLELDWLACLESDYSGADGVDMEGLHKKSDTIEEWMPDDGSGKKEVCKTFQA